MPVAYVAGLQMRRAAELHAGSAKTDLRHVRVLDDFARRHDDQLVWLDVTEDLLAKLRILNGRDVDLAEDANRASNRTRDALVLASPPRGATRARRNVCSFDEPRARRRVVPGQIRGR